MKATLVLLTRSADVTVILTDVYDGALVQLTRMIDGQNFGYVQLSEDNPACRCCGGRFAVVVGNNVAGYVTIPQTLEGVAHA